MLQQKKRKTEYMCNTFPILQKLKSRKTLKQHTIKMHEGRTDMVKLGKLTIYLTEADVSNHYLKRTICELCDEMFFCKQNLDEHRNSIHR